MDSSAKPSALAMLTCCARKKCAERPPMRRTSQPMKATMASTTSDRGTEYHSMMNRTEAICRNMVSRLGRAWLMSCLSVSTSLV